MVQKHIVELVKWRSKEGIEDDKMIAAVDGILPDLKALPGFISKTLCKDDSGFWVDLYSWETRAQAETSNDLMAPRPAFQALMDLVDPSSISITFLSPQVSSR